VAEEEEGVEEGEEVVEAREVVVAVVGEVTASEPSAVAAVAGEAAAAVAVVVAPEVVGVVVGAVIVAVEAVAAVVVEGVIAVARVVAVALAVAPTTRSRWSCRLPRAYLSPTRMLALHSEWLQWCGGSLCRTKLGGASSCRSYLTATAGFGGVLKQRFSDFIVNEVDMDGNVVHLTSLLQPPASAGVRRSLLSPCRCTSG
jgi:hypothetical protein